MSLMQNQTYSHEGEPDLISARNHVATGSERSENDGKDPITEMLVTH